MGLGDGRVQLVGVPQAVPDHAAVGPGDPDLLAAQRDAAPEVVERTGHEALRVARVTEATERPGSALRVATLLGSFQRKHMLRIAFRNSALGKIEIAPRVMN